MTGSLRLTTALGALAAVGTLLLGPSTDRSDEHDRPVDAATTPDDPGAGAGAAGRGEPVVTPASGVGTTVPRPRWRWPVRPVPPVVRLFDGPATPYGAGHRGLDLAAPDGTPVRAVEAGVVTHAGTVATRGTVTVEHHGGLRSTYEPVTAVVGRGDQVAAGDVVGHVTTGSTTHCRSPCLHLGARRGEVYLDPRPLLAGGRVRLFPVGDGRG